MTLGVDTAVVRGVFPPGVVVHPKPAPVKVRRAMQIIGMNSCSKFILHNNSLVNVRRALMERVYNVEVNGNLVQPPQPRPNIFGTLRALGGELAARVGERAPVARTTFVQSRPAAKLKIYQQGLASLMMFPVIRRDARVQGAFVKCEKVNAKKGDPAPRIIQPRSVRYNIEVGRYLSVIEHDVYHEIDEMWGGKTVMKGYNADEIGTHIKDAWDSFADPVALGLDASRFDQHVSADALGFEHSIYNLIFNSPELRKLLRWQVDNEGVATADDGVILYKKRGSRMSGDMNTALGNIILMCLLVLLFCQQRRVKARLINNGDDCTLIFERADLATILDGLYEWFLQYGFNIVQEPVAHQIEEIEFCQMHPVWVDGKYVMVRNAGPSLSKDAISIRARTPQQLRQWMWCVGKSGLAMASGVPIQQAYYLNMAKHGVKGGRLDLLEGRSGLTWFASRMVATEREVSDLTRLSFWKAFGVDPALQVAIEQEIATTALPPNEIPNSETLTFFYI